MKKLLVLLMALLSFCILADERIVIGSFEQESTEAESILHRVTVSEESTLNGFGARIFDFRDEGLYIGAGFSFVTGDSDLCEGSDCVSVDATRTGFFGELGRNFGRLTPFFGASFDSKEIDGGGHTDSDEPFGINAGFWLELDKLKIRGAGVYLDDEENRAITGGFLFQMDNKFALGAEFGMLVADEVDGFRFSLQFGRKF
ncbi:MAG: hypothetical protein F4X56_00110 [Gammaproteobacteria bacterium]|nr:hypothetical protein [Gammaproteobacteria bacterium]